MSSTAYVLIAWPMLSGLMGYLFTVINPKGLGGKILLLMLMTFSAGGGASLAIMLMPYIEQTLRFFGDSSFLVCFVIFTLGPGLIGIIIWHIVDSRGQSCDCDKAKKPLNNPSGNPE